MKKLLLLFLSFAIFLHQGQAQSLYAVTYAGGDQGVGAIIKFTPSTAISVAVHSFAQNDSGFHPFGTLLKADDNKLYGTTSNGGAYAQGTLFSYDPAEMVFTKLKDFDGINVRAQSLIQASDGRIYGTAYGGASGFGVIFCYDPVDSSLTQRAEFNGVNGSGPGTLMQAKDGKLYGITGAGGNFNAPIFPDGFGVLFSFDISTDSITKLIDFDAINGVKPVGRLVAGADDKLYGMTPLGGTFGQGNIFSFDPLTGTANSLFSFNGNNGAVPQGNSLIRGSDNKLYGMTANENTIFSFDPVTTTQTPFSYFNDSAGLTPYGNLLQLGTGKFYGMTFYGGRFNLGTIFSFDPTIPAYIKLTDFDGTNGANPWIENAFTPVDDCTVDTLYYKDADGDGYGNPDSSISSCIRPQGYVTNNADCDDSDKRSHGPVTYYRDFDHDLLGDPAVTISVCGAPPAGYVKNNFDCDDKHAAHRFWSIELSMCHNGETECVRLKDVWAKLYHGWKLGPCADANGARSRSITGPARNEFGKQGLPTQYSISNYPNPFAGSSTIRYELPMDSKVTIKVYDPLGRALTTLVNEEKKAGRYSVNFNAGRSGAGELFYRITAKSTHDQFEQTNRMIIVR